MSSTNTRHVPARAGSAMSATHDQPAAIPVYIRVGHSAQPAPSTKLPSGHRHTR
jgi:hypothetical protein